MPAPTKGARLGGSPAHQRIILANLATQLFEHGRIVTTEAKARRLRPLAERLITKAKRGDLHARRMVLTTVRDKSVVHQLFTEIAPGFAAREGGYTRITKVGPRKGDNAPMAVIELVTESIEESRKASAKGRAATSAPPKASARTTGTAPAEPAMAPAQPATASAEPPTAPAEPTTAPAEQVTATAAADEPASADHGLESNAPAAVDPEMGEGVEQAPAPGPQTIDVPGRADPEDAGSGAGGVTPVTDDRPSDDSSDEEAAGR